LEEAVGQRISHVRVDEAMRTGARALVTACPYCLQMLHEAVQAKQLEEQLQVLDLAELADGEEGRR
jgi:Fe-S oxidoreductase